MLITVFTPTYNRAYIIKQLYDSLCRQTSQDFEWLIVDDGSTDNTKGLISTFISESKISIRYFWQKNGGKHSAINLGVNEAKSGWFFIVDSDDYVTNDAIEKIKEECKVIEYDDRFCGVSGRRQRPDGSIIGNKQANGIIDATSLDFFHITNSKSYDRADIYKTAILKKYPFPIVEGENFVAESIVWNRLSNDKYLLRFVNEVYVVCEYREDGLSKASVRNRHKCSTLSTLLYSELAVSYIPFKQRFRALINYWRFSFSFQGKKKRIKGVSVLLNTIAYLMGYILFQKDKILKLVSQNVVFPTPK